MRHSRRCIVLFESECLNLAVRSQSGHMLAHHLLDSILARVSAQDCSSQVRCYSLLASRLGMVLLGQVSNTEYCTKSYHPGTSMILLIMYRYYRYRWVSYWVKTVRPTVRSSVSKCPSSRQGNYRGALRGLLASKYHSHLLFWKDRTNTFSHCWEYISNVPTGTLELDCRCKESTS